MGGDEGLYKRFNDLDNKDNRSWTSIKTIYSVKEDVVPGIKGRTRYDSEPGLMTTSPLTLSVPV